MSKKKGVERKPQFVPVIAQAFIELGFARTTTAEIASRCGVRENELYRIWPNKLQMFIESIRFIYTTTVAHWELEFSKPNGGSSIEKLIEYHSKDHGHLRFYRLVYSGLIEVESKEVQRELKMLYKNFHSLLTDYIREFREQTAKPALMTPEETAWTIMGIASVVDIQRELGLLPKRQRAEFMLRVAGGIVTEM